MADDIIYEGNEFEALEGADNYYRWILRLFGPRLGGRVAEIGAGRGNFSHHLVAAPRVESAVLIEPAANQFAELSSRFAGDDRVSCRSGFFGDASPAAPFDSIVAVNVLEHVPDDIGLATTVREALAPNGTAFIFVPALPRLYGSLDDEFDHVRRYTKPGLRRVMEDAGFRTEKLHYVNLPGIVSWFLAGRVFRQRTIGKRQVAGYDRLVVPWLSRLERVVRPPVGQSLVALGVPDDQAT